MGAMCSGGFHEPTTRFTKKELKVSGKVESTKESSKLKENHEPNLHADRVGKTPLTYHSGELMFSRETKESAVDGTKAAQKASFLDKAGNVGMEVLDTLGSSMSNFHYNSGFISGLPSRGNKISMLSFEVANTIAKGVTLFRSFSEENIIVLKKEILHSEGVQLLVSTDMNKLLSIAASDKRVELDIFSREVIRFGDLCKDPQWHHLDRFFSNLDSDNSVDKQFRADVEIIMKDLNTMTQHTSELYHELHALDGFELDFKHKIEDIDASQAQLPRKGESLMILQSELKQQRKLVRSLKKKSLWSRSLEEIVEKLVDIVTYIHLAIVEAFGANGMLSVSSKETQSNDTLTGNANTSEDTNKSSQRLGPTGLALHYATVINQIDNIASRPASVPPSTRETLYHGLPESIKNALRSRLQSTSPKEELSVTQVKDEMEKTFKWIVPLATNTTKAHQGFGWVGEWANTGGGNEETQNSIIRLQTLYHADAKKVDHYILELATLLNHLISLVRQQQTSTCCLKTSPNNHRSPTRKEVFSKIQRHSSFNNATSTNKILLTQEDMKLLNKTSRRKLLPGISKSQEFVVAKKRVLGSSRSTGSSPIRELGCSRQRSTNILDVMDGLDSSY